ncbi:RsmB/NOP family class I SAM-dependent RNA methyltransferase [Actinocrinis sp.]|uniref:RsmB/NOP family class I SAM-dependent RNA methyltransferase n=1 Tax=Actinocrinis sp. TaxID=1920516 RepID=UPI002D4F8501|nr:transcription antitermination factor NusB [Actinocrinis sp.]HZP53039.1 transcription antitermination factor NusB [Actinocrinis sp.]
MRTDPARLAAYDTLRAVAEREAYANLVLPRLLAERRLDARDAALATELAYGALRGRGTYDAILSACVDRPLAQLDPEVLDVLRLGAHQLLATRIPPHAAVDSSVELAREVAHEGAARMVNAVLRKVARLDLRAWVDRVAPDPGRDPEGYLAVYRSHPVWVVSALWDSLAAHRGKDAAYDEIDRLLEADNERPGVTLAARPGLAEQADLVKQGAEPGRYASTAAYLPEGDPARLEAVARGRAGVQDEGSQLVALALMAAPLGDRAADADRVADVYGDGDDLTEADSSGADSSGADSSDGDRLWLDLCAGPGGKAALLAATGAQRGARLVAAEIAPHRARLVKRALQPIRGVHKVVTADGTQPPWRPATFDRVLLDAPCTGLGALRRRPESRWRREPADVSRLAELQKRLLASALDSARPGGLVAYVTCSPHLAETRLVVSDVLARRDDVEQLDARPYLPGVPELGDGPDVQLWPHLHDTDAMYLALLRRV